MATKGEQASLNRNAVVSTLFKIGHGNLDLYIEPGLECVRRDPELWAHITAWNALKGEVRDSKVAFPAVGLRGITDYHENAVAHAASLAPRELVRLVDFSRRLTGLGKPVMPGAGNLLEAALKRYLKERERKCSWWDSTVVSNREAMRTLYAWAHVKPSRRAQAILFERNYPKDSVFEAIRNLKNMTAQEAAGTILSRKIPFPIAIGAVKSIKDADILLALIDQMSGNELVNFSKTLEKLGVMTSPVLKSAYDAAVERSKSDKRMSSAKATAVAGKVGGKAAKQLEQLGGEKKRQMGGIEGNHLVACDMSGSMHSEYDLALLISSEIAQAVKGEVTLSFFDTNVKSYDVSGMSLDDIKQACAGARRGFGGSTSIGAPLQRLLEAGKVVNCISLVTDTGENASPYFGDVYKKYAAKLGVEPTVYIFATSSGRSDFTANLSRSGVEAETFDVRNVDYYSIPNLVRSMRVSKYALVDEILDTPLLTLDAVFSKA